MGVGKVRDWNYLDGEELFAMWVELGSLTKIREALIRRNVVNPATKKFPTQAGIRVAVRRWQAQNVEKSRQIMIEHGEEWALDDEEWNKWLVHQARGALGNRAFETFISDNDLEEYRNVQYQ